MANQLTFKATANNTTSILEFQNPVNNNWYDGVLVSGTSGDYQLIMTSIPSGTYTNLKARVKGNPTISSTITSNITVTDPSSSLASRSFTSNPIYSKTLTNYLPTSFKKVDLDFSKSTDVNALTSTYSTNVALQNIEAEGSGWTFTDSSQDSVNGWANGDVGVNNRNTGSSYSRGGPGFPRSRTETFRYIKLFAQQDKTLGTLILALTRNGTTTTYPFTQNGDGGLAANYSGGTDGTTPQISVDLGTSATTTIAVYSSKQGDYCSFDAISIQSDINDQSTATKTTNSKLQLAPDLAGQQNSVTAIAPKGGWWTVEVDIASVLNPTNFSYADIFIGIFKNSANYIGGVFHAKDGTMQAVACIGGVAYSGPNLGGGLNIPGSLKVVCTGTGLTVLYKNTNGSWIDLPMWIGPNALLQTGIYDGTWKYGVFGSVSGSGWDAQISNFRAGYFGGVNVGDNSMILYEDGSPVIINNKRLWAGSARGFGLSNITFNNFIRNNMCVILSEDTTTGEFDYYSVVFHKWSLTNEIQGEGSPCFVIDRSTSRLHSFTPAWHFADTDSVLKVRNAYGYTTQSLSEGIDIVINSSVRHYDAAKPDEVAYDVCWTKVGSTWIGCTTVQYVNGENNGGTFQMYGKVVQTTNLDADTFTVVKTDTTTGFADAYEGWRLLLFNGTRYFVGAGYTKLRVLDLSGNFVCYFNQPNSATVNVQNQQYASHFAAYQTTYNGDSNRIAYIAFDGTRFRSNWQYAYGTSHKFISDAI